MIAPTALVVSKDPCLIGAVRGVVDIIENLQLRTCPEISKASSLLSRNPVALALIHLTDESENQHAVDLLGHVAASKKPIPTVVLSDQYRAEQALALLRLGVADYLDRPLDLGRLTYLIDKLTVRARYLARSAAAEAQRATIRSLGDENPFFYLPSGNMSGLIDQVKRVAGQDTTLLLSGETGTGKTRLARLVHELSPRRDLPFFVVSCGALSDTLIESQLFGHVKGAFTGADRDHTGKFAHVGRGTLLLDEIDALPLPLQAKLLRVVEDRVYEPVGSNQELPVQARLIAASNRDLDQEVRNGRFRRDLYFRLNVVSFHLSPLRERRDLISPLAYKFLSEFAVRSGRDLQGVSDDAIHYLSDYDWPGNIRELRNVIERAVALCAGPEIRPDDLPEAMLTPPAASESSSPVPGPAACAVPVRTLNQTKEEAELLRITQALQKHDNNRQRAAAELGISRMSLYNKLHKYGLVGAT